MLDERSASDGKNSPHHARPGIRCLRLFRLFSELVLPALSLLVCGVAAAAEETAPVAPRTVAVPVRSQGFDILEIAVDGNTLLSELDIQLALEPFVGEQRKATDVDAARAALEALYKSRGYKTVTVAIPRQTIRDGLVLLDVVEGRIASLEVHGSQYTSLEQLKLEVPSLAEGKVPDFEQVEKELTYANRLPNRRVTPSLTAGQTPGTVDIDLKVDDQLPLRASVELNNRHGRDTSNTRAVATFGYDNLWQLGHSLTLSFQTAPQRSDDGSVYYGSYRAPLGDGSWNLTFTALRTSSSVAALSGVDVLGSGRSYGLELSKQFGAVAGVLYPSISAGIDYKNFNTVASVGQGAEIRTPAKYYPLSLGYSQLIKLTGQSLQSDVTLNLASPQLGSDSQTIDLNRFKARGQQMYLRASFAYNHDLPFNFEAGWRGSGQLSDQPLISSEQYSAGGMDNVRGYVEAESLGDHGYFSSLELRAPSLSEYLDQQGWMRFVTDLRPYVFYDFADVRLRGPFLDRSSARSSFLSSTGAGLGFRFFDHLGGSLIWALPLQKGPATPDNDNRVLFRISASL